MNNAYIDFYTEHSISPVHQDISDYSRHLLRREKLYRQLGMPICMFKNINMAEIGPGGGYNTLCFLEWGAKVDLIEPNTTGVRDINKLFEEKRINKTQYKIFQIMVEDFIPTRKYDIIIAEGFLPCLNNKREIVDKIEDMLTENGVVVVTCMDEIGLFVEQLKRLVGNILVNDVTNYEDKVKRLVDIFDPQLKMLQGVSRSTEDWVQDQLLCPTINNEELFSLEDAINLFGDEFEVLGSSPNMFTDYSWYKDINYPYKEQYLKQFGEKRNNLLLAGTEENIWGTRENLILISSVKEIRKLCVLFEDQPSRNLVDKIVIALSKLEQENPLFDIRIKDYLSETKNILLNIFEKDINFSNYPVFMQAFGRSQQYISLYKKTIIGEK